MLGTRTRGARMECAEESTELWQQMIICFFEGGAIKVKQLFSHRQASQMIEDSLHREAK